MVDAAGAAVGATDTGALVGAPEMGAVVGARNDRYSRDDSDDEVGEVAPPSSASTTTSASSAGALQARSPTATASSSSGKEHKSKCFTLNAKDKSGNYTYRCIFPSCTTVIGKTVKAQRTHASQHGDEWLAKYDNNTSSSKPQTSLLQHGFRPQSAEEKEAAAVANGDVIGTAANLREKLALFLILHRLAFRTCDSLALRRLLVTAINYGVQLSKPVTLDTAKLPSRKTIISTTIEPEDGLVAQFASAAVWRIEHLARPFGAQISFDGATDCTGQSLEVFVLASCGAKVLLSSVLAGVSRKDVAWMVRVLIAVLSGNVDQERMMLRDVDYDADDEEFVGEEYLPDSSAAATTFGAKDGSAAKRANVHSVGKILATIYALTRFVAAMGGDNAIVPVMAVMELEVQEGIVPYGCCAHAISKNFQHVCAIPQIKHNVVDKVKLILGLYCSSSFVARLFKDRDCGLIKIANTRFIVLVLVCQRLKVKKDGLLAAVELTAWAKFKSDARTPPATKAKMTQVANIIKDEQFWAWLDFFLSFSLGHVVAVRAFDADATASVGFVYSFWMKLAHTTAHAFAKQEDKTMATPELYQAMRRVLFKDWEKFSFPVYGAGFVLNPYTFDEFGKLMLDEPTVGCELEKLALDTCITVCRRFLPDGLRRMNVLAVDDETLPAMRRKLEEELVLYQSAVPDVGNEVHSPPVWWMRSGGAFPLLRMCAMKILSISPSTCAVERTHKVFKEMRASKRNRLGYARAHALNFINCEEKAEFNSTAATAWKTVLHYKLRFDVLADVDAKHLQQLMEANASATKQATQEAEEEQIATPQTMALNEEEEEEEEEDAVPVVPPSTKYTVRWWRTRDWATGPAYYTTWLWTRIEFNLVSYGGDGQHHDIDMIHAAAGNPDKAHQVFGADDDRSTKAVM